MGLIDMAAFMGLACAPEQALQVWTEHRNAATHSGNGTHSLLLETQEWMNATMARLLPEPLVYRWGLVPTDL